MKQKNHRGPYTPKTARTATGVGAIHPLFETLLNAVRPPVSGARPQSEKRQAS